MTFKKFCIIVTITLITSLNINIIKADERLEAAIDQIQIISQDLTF